MPWAAAWAAAAASHPRWRADIIPGICLPLCWCEIVRMKAWHAFWCCTHIAKVLAQSVQIVMHLPFPYRTFEHDRTGIRMRMRSLALAHEVKLQQAQQALPRMQDVNAVPVAYLWGQI